MHFETTKRSPSRPDKNIRTQRQQLHAQATIRAARRRLDLSVDILFFGIPPREIYRSLKLELTSLRGRFVEKLKIVIMNNDKHNVDSIQTYHKNWILKDIQRFAHNKKK